MSSSSAAGAAGPVLRPVLPPLRASLIIHAHTLLATLTFLSTLALALALHYRLVVRNAIAAWPDEWWPSVSATIGDWTPERPWFQVGIALCSGPRFGLVLVQWLVTRRKKLTARHVSPSGSSSPQGKKRGTWPGFQWSREDWLAFVGVARTLCCGGWVYVTSSDHHDFHDAAMIAYMLLTLPWMVGATMTTPAPGFKKTITEGKQGVENAGDNAGVRRWRLRIASAFHLTLVPLIYYYIQHSIKRIPGAYSKYAILEWLLVAWDVAFDACGAWVEEVQRLQLQINYAADNYSSSTSEDDNMALQPARESRFGPNVFELPPELAGWVPIGPETSRARAFVSHIVDVYLAFCFWTIFTSLGPTLFYFSVWKLALSGSELSLLSLLSPYLLAWPAISRWATSRRGQGWLRVLGLTLGLGAFVAPWPVAKVLVVFAANVAQWLALGATLRRLKGGRAAADEGKYLLLGLFFHVALKYYHYSVNPMWAMSAVTDRPWKWCGLALAAGSAVEKQLRPSVSEPQAPPPVKENASEPQYIGWGRFAVTIGLGSALFLLQTLFTDATSIIAWSWSGFPATGLTYNHAPFVALAALSGLFTLQAPKGIVFAPLAIASACLLVFYNDRLAFIGGAWLLSGVVGHIPELLAAASAGPTASILGGAMLLLVILDVLSVVTVAYAFVPLGQYLRERTDVVMVIAVACVGAGSMAMRRNPQVSNAGRRLSNFVALATAGLCVAFVALKAYTLSYASAPQPFHPNTGLFTAGIWTVHFGMDEDGLESQGRMLDLIRGMQLDVVGLLESDLHRFVYGSRDLTRQMVEELGYFVDIGPGPDKHTWGAALLSKFPILESRHHLLPSPHGELAPAIHAKLLIHGQVVNVIVAHNGQEEDALDRQLQSEAIANITRSTYPEPFLSLQYVVTAVGAARPAPYQILTTEGQMWDTEISDYDRWCEYILFRNLWRIGFARVSHGDITDTELQVGKFIVPHRDYDVGWYSTNEELYFHTPEDGLPASWRFPSEYRGDGVRGHKYHVWDGPLYYAPPQRWWDAHAMCIGKSEGAGQIWPCPGTTW